jgi:hypothetical protein
LHDGSVPLPIQRSLVELAIPLALLLLMTACVLGYWLLLRPMRSAGSDIIERVIEHCPESFWVASAADNADDPGSSQSAHSLPGSPVVAPSSPSSSATVSLQRQLSPVSLALPSVLHNILLACCRY